MRIARRALLGAGAALFGAVLAPGRAHAQQGLIERLSLNESAFGPSPRVIAALHENLHDLNRYVEAEDIAPLTAQIAALERVAPEQIVLGELLSALGVQLAAARPGGGEFIYSAPGYTALIDASAPLGGVGRPAPLNAALQNDLPALAALVGARTLAVSLVNPHNPSGTVNPAEAFDAFVRETAQRTLVIVDEAYLEYDEFERRSAIRFARAGENVLVFRTLSKIYGLAGLSLGYAVAPRALVDNLKAAGVGSPHSLNRPALIAAQAALGDQAYVAEIAARNRANRDALHAALDQLGLERTESRASFVFFRSPRPAAEVRTELEAHGLIVGRAFPPLDEWIRITVGRDHETQSTIAALRAIYARRRRS